MTKLPIHPDFLGYPLGELARREPRNVVAASNLFCVNYQGSQV